MKSFIYSAVLVSACLYLSREASFAQNKKHPEANSPGPVSEVTDREIYTYNRVYEIDHLFLGEANEYSEQSIFYDGYFDAWKQKENKSNALYYQLYIVPPHSIPLFKKTYIDATEVANIHYQEFLHFVERDSGQDIHDSYLPVLDEKYMKNYYNNPEFYFFPVIGINPKGAKTYCDWRAQNLNEGLQVFLENESPYKKYKYVGRLPTEHEWKRAAGHSTKEIEDRTYEISKKGLEFLKNDVVDNGFADKKILESETVYGYNVNLDHGTDFAINKEIPFYIYGFEPRTSGTYNMYGNVKEIVNEGYAIGGSYKSKNTHVELHEHTETFDYQTDIGFRCITKIVR
ncbi:Sulfatase-modifying factor enzyme 1 [Reichenbachiella faecimaris]|uniref:Sulfatase-modifying factor enzyme 1 n=1 Tax=Reichenbachiella faecimaris TaxID=692418 RepID=A0A1W2G6X2_REIFA|nr:SUMF1/EgtB/PvdO family nonheme iron enzyme [Reichenbachiella faecimaris]SMD32351.1 Sulfatase-modifying factor enzyme 1 [Reichenbachiella faecimaris]